MGIKKVYEFLSFLTYFWAKRRAKEIELEDKKRYVWIHAASMGEVNSIIPLVKELEKINASYFLTTMTISGKRFAENSLSSKVFLFPFDNLYFIKKLLKKVKIGVFTEGEIWPNTVLEFRKKRIPIILINGRISKKGFIKWKLFRREAKVILNSFDKIFVQSQREKKFLEKLQVKKDKIDVVCNLKFLNLNSEKKKLFDPPFSKVITFASLRTKEFQGIVKVIKNILEKFSDIGIVIAPRHVEAVFILENMLKKEGIEYTKRTKSKIWEKNFRIYIIDTLGELKKVFLCSDIVIVGGTFAPYGGHNLLEPAQFKVPVIFGPFTENVKLMEKILLEKGGGIKVKNFSSLLNILRGLLENEKKLNYMKERAYLSALEAKTRSKEGFEKILKFLLLYIK